MANPTLATYMEMFDLFHKERPTLSDNPPDLEPYRYELVCYCGEQLLLVPHDGESVSCPCGATATYDGKVSLEP